MAWRMLSGCRTGYNFQFGNVIGATPVQQSDILTVMAGVAGSDVKFTDVDGIFINIMGILTLRQKKVNFLFWR